MTFVKFLPKVIDKSIILAYNKTNLNITKNDCEEDGRIVWP